MRKINPFFGDPNLDSSTLGLNDMNLHLQWTKCTFNVGDSVKITFGPHNGVSGTITVVTDDTVTMMATNFVDVSKHFCLLSNLLLT